MAVAKRPLSEAAYRWHHKPVGAVHATCPTCGLGMNRRGLHRAARQEEASQFSHFLRPGGQRPDFGVMPHGANRTSQRGTSKPRKPTGPTRATRELLVKLAMMKANGKTTEQAAAELGKTFSAVNDLLVTYREIFSVALDRAVQLILEIVRSDAGTDRVYLDPDGHLARSRSAKKWTKQRGEPLFEAKGETTLTTFHREYVVPTRLAEASPRTRDAYEESLALWAYVTGDPPLNEITARTLAAFVEFLKKLRGRKVGSLMSAYTVRKHLKNVQAVLDKAATPCFRNRDAAGVLDGAAPWIRPPKVPPCEPGSVSDADLEAVYNAAPLAERPRLPCVKPAAWWRALIVLALFTGLRKGTLLRLRIDDLEWKTGVLNVRRAINKGGRKRLVIELPEVVMKHLVAIRADRDLLLPWPHAGKYFYTHLGKLLAAAGIPKARWFGPQALRRTFGTKLFAVNPGAAQLALGHSSMATTIGHYVRVQGIVKENVDRLQMPEIFRSGRDDNAPPDAA